MSMYFNKKRYDPKEAQAYLATLQCQGFCCSEFRSNGPVEASEKALSDFQKTCTEYQINFDSMFYAWTCERYTDGFRRLCLRNLLRQFNYFDTPAKVHNIIIFYPIGQPASRLFSIGKKLDNPSNTLRYTLYNRPKLLEEFLEEFLYNLEHHFYDNANSKGFVAETIELLLTLPVSNNISNQLWPCYPYADLKDVEYPHEWMRRYLNLMSSPDLPKKIFNELRRSLTRSLNSEIDKFRDHVSQFQHTKVFGLNTHDKHFPILTYASEWIVDHLTDPTESQLETITFLINFLEDRLPIIKASVFYLSLANVIKLAQKLDLPTAIRLVRRHVTVYRDAYGYHTNADEITLTNLTYLRGFCIQYLADDGDIQDITTELINYRSDTHPA